MGNTISMDQKWLQTLIGQLTPRFGEFASDVLSCQVEPLIQKVFRHSNVPNVNFKFTKMDFGDIPPQISNLETHGTPEGQELARSITIDFDINYLGNCDLQVDLCGTTSGVRDLQISGRGRIVMKPTTKQVPFVGGVQFCFLDIPRIDFDLDGIADVINLAPIKRKVREELGLDMAKRCVYPNCFKMSMADGVDIEAVKAFEPTAMLVVKLISAEELPKKGGLRSLIGQDLPDPYAKVRLGGQVFKSAVVKNCREPSWTDSFQFLLDTQKGHKLRIDVFDEDSCSKDDFLGHVILNITDLPQNEPVIESLELLDDEWENSTHNPIQVSGQITIELYFLPLKLEVLENPTFQVLSIFVYSCNNLIQDLETNIYPTTRITVQVGDQIETSQVKKNNPHPNFEQSFVMILDEDTTEGMIKITDTECGQDLGSVILNIDQIKTYPLKRKIVLINPEVNPYMTTTISANVKLC